jgi:LysR family transcriptional regulator of gallate degradation
MKIKQARVAVAVAQMGSMTAAAEALGLSQPAVTRSIGILEEQLGAILFERNPAGVAPASAAQVLLHSLAEAFACLYGISSQGALAPSEFVTSVRQDRIVREVTDAELLAVASLGRYGSARRVAEELEMSRSAVGRTLAAFAARVGRELYLSDGSLAEWAQDAALVAQKALRIIAEAERRFTLREHVNRGCVRLKIGALPAPRVALIPAAIQRLVAGLDSCEIKIVDGDYEGLLSCLYAGEIDVIVGSARQNKQPSWLQVEHLFEDRMVIVSSPNHPLQNLPELDEVDLRAARWVLPGQKTPVRLEFENLMASHAALRPSQVVEVDSFVVARSLILSGEWLGIISASQIRQDELSKSLKRLPVAHVAPRRMMAAMVRANETPSRQLANFLSHLRATAQEVFALTQTQG